jgi:hypothetical protein
MKQLFANRIYLCLFNITASYGVIAQINTWMSGAGYWLTKPQNFVFEIVCYVAVATMMIGLQRVLYPDLKTPPLKVFSKSTLVETLASVFVLVCAQILADTVSFFLFVSQVGIVHFVLMAISVVVIALGVSSYVHRKGFLAAQPIAHA